MGQGNSLTSCLGVLDPQSSNSYVDNGVIQRSVTSGLNRICYYNQLGSVFSMTIDRNRLCPISMNRYSTPSKMGKFGGFLRRNYRSGLNRICVYDNVGSLYMKTIPANNLCPLNLR